MITAAPIEPDVLVVTAMMVFLSFTIDRIVSVLLFLMSFNRAWDRKFPEPTLIKSPAERFKVEKRHKLVYFLLAALLTTGILVFANQVRVLAKLGFDSAKTEDGPKTGGTANTNSTTVATTSSSPLPSPGNNSNTGEPTRTFKFLDFFLTALILIGGADRLEQLMKLRGSSGRSESTQSKPLEISGKITLDDQAIKKDAPN